NNIISGFFAARSATIELDTSLRNTLSHVTTHAGVPSLRVKSSSDGNTFSQILSIGFVDVNSSDSLIFAQLATAGVTLASSSNNTFTENFWVHSANCSVTGGANQGLVDATCANQGSSNATLSNQNWNPLDSVVGVLSVDDTVNTDPSYTSAYAAITD